MLWKTIAILLSVVPVWAGSCEELSKLELPHTTITLAKAIGISWPVTVRGVPPAPKQPFCRIAATVRPTSDSEILIEVWMPESGWNGKYEAVGNGGWSGSISYSPLAAAVTAGYAASATDTGHQGSSARFALGHPEKLIDYAYRSEHEMAVAAKAVIAAFYGKGPRLSYWNGCSAGGKQGLKEAQRYPEDFDGIVAGSPAANWTGRAAQSIWVAQAVHKDDASYIPPDKYPLIHRAALAACDELDGVTDGVIENPLACKFDPAVLQCKEGDTSECLNARQVEAARKIYAPSVNPRTGERLYSGLAPGSELSWQIWGGPKPLSIGLDYFRYVVFEDPNWDFQALDFDRDVARAEGLERSRINATDPNLKPFFARGGKLIQYHGWSDAQISPGNSVDYYHSVTARLGNVDDSYRLFMVPGMAHCGGGEGATSFDATAALEQWVEQKKAPGQIIASRARDAEVDWTHPLCPYPKVAVYAGKGNPRDAANYVCRVTEAAHLQR
ncbi:MAG TPA: tannase/feruloyl esterase family alpha/beta hydrolase [Bryobacteraceae bacterium]|nr:tannase/feruloyl esterase family alpha/beta hydrolase [Bryobacteraceae bacterium]